MASLKECLDYYIDRIDFIINNVPPNITSLLVKFENNNKDGSIYTFAPRRSYERVKKVFRLLVSFLILKGDRSVRKFVSFVRRHKDLAPERSFKRCIVGQFLHELVCEESVWSVRTNLLEFCELLCFHIKRRKLSLKTCDYAGSELGHVLHLLRCGTCGYVLYRVHKHINEGGDASENYEIASSIVEKSKRGEAIHFICRWIHVLRYMASLKTPNRNVIVDEWGNIIVDGLEFKKLVYSRTIINVAHSFQTCFDQIFVGNIYQHFLRVEFKISDIDISTGNAKIVVPDEGEYRIKDLKISDAIFPNEERFDTMVSLCEFAFHGLGGGSMLHDRGKMESLLF